MEDMWRTSRWRTPMKVRSPFRVIIHIFRLYAMLMGYYFRRHRHTCGLSYSTRPLHAAHGNICTFLGYPYSHPRQGYDRHPGIRLSTSEEACHDHELNRIRSALVFLKCHHESRTIQRIAQRTVFRTSYLPQRPSSSLYHTFILFQPV